MFYVLSFVAVILFMSAVAFRDASLRKNKK
jgi:hypothetical protein